MKTYRIKLLNAYSDTVHLHAVQIAPGDIEDDEIVNTLCKLLRHSWTLHPGDTIKIEGE